MTIGILAAFVIVALIAYRMGRRDERRKHEASE
jgi:hypothetical protein